MVKAGRTHLMDAVPITLGQEAGGWATQVEYGAARLRDVLPRLGQLPIGGTAVGTGLNAPDGFGAGVVDELRAATGLDVLTEAADHIEAQGARDGLVEASGALRTVAVSLFKIANDLRWLGSGPAHRAGRAAPARPAAGQLDHAGQGQPGDLRGDDDGGRAGDRQRRHRRVRRQRRATSSST